MATYTKTITVNNGTTEVATGTLVVTTGTPNTGTFTPTGPIAGTEIDCSGAPVWTDNDGGTVNFGFQITGTSNNGSFPPGTYRFNGTQTSTGNPDGTVVWPSAQGPDAEETDTWQASATQVDPAAMGQGAG